VSRIRGLIRARDFAEALSAGEALLAETPDQRDALLFVAIAQRYLGRVPNALDTLATLARHHPRFSRVHEDMVTATLAMKAGAGGHRGLPARREPQSRIARQLVHA